MITWKPTSKTALVTHKGCLDGTGSAMVFILAGGLRENVIFSTPANCNLAVDQAARFDEVWFADLCPAGITCGNNYLQLTESVAGGKPFHVFDHHIINQTRYKDDPSCTFSMSHSGTSLMARELLNINDFDGSNFCKLIKALESYDLGDFDNEHGVRLADIAASFSQDEMLDILIDRDAESVLFDNDLSNRADAMASIRRLYSQNAAKRARIVVFDGMKMAVAVAPIYWKNDVAQRVLATGLTDIVMIIDVSSQMVSLRSTKDGPNCNNIAERYGGGGHIHAAGFKANGGAMLDALFESVVG